jgi:hypothetical protein
MILRRERDNSRSLDKGERIAKVNYGIGVLGGGRGKRDVQFLRRGRLYYREATPLRAVWGNSSATIRRT